jgi:PAS domain S-box-containing protein
VAEHPDPEATGAPTPVPGDGPGAVGRETHEREAALARDPTGPIGIETRHTEFPPFVKMGAHKLFTLLADNVRDYAVFLMDADGVIRYWGEGARLMKWWTTDQAEGSHLRILYMDGGSEDGTAEDHLRTAAGKGEYTGEGQRVRNDGSTFWAGVTLTALRDDDGTLLGFAKTTRDFSARRAVEAALQASHAAVEGQRVAEEADRLKTLFIGAVSQEIREPLNAMMGFLQMLTREGERQQANVDRLINSGTHLMQVVDEVLDMSRIDSGQVLMNSTAAQIGAAIRPALSDVVPKALAKGVRVSNAVSGGAAETPYWGDPARVEQIIANLLASAVQYTPRGGEVRISGGTIEHSTNLELHGRGPWTYVRVEDTGAGIPADQLEKLFEPFERTTVGQSLSKGGLSLPISRRLARLMGGDLTARSEVGVGSEFVLILPIAATRHVPR